MSVFVCQCVFQLTRRIVIHQANDTVMRSNMAVTEREDKVSYTELIICSGTLCVITMQYSSANTVVGATLCS